MVYLRTPARWYTSTTRPPSTPSVLKAPTTWAELKEAAKKAKEKGKYIATWQQDEVGYQISGQAAAAGAHWYKPEGDKWKVEVTDAASKKVATFLQELNDERPGP